MEPESEKPRNVPEDSSRLPPYYGSNVALGIYLVSLVMNIGAAYCVYMSQPGVAANLFVSGMGLLGIAKIASYLGRLVQLREWELTRQLKKEE